MAHFRIGNTEPPRELLLVCSGVFGTPLKIYDSILAKMMEDQNPSTIFAEKASSQIFDKVLKMLLKHFQYPKMNSTHEKIQCHFEGRLPSNFQT